MQTLHQIQAAFEKHLSLERIEKEPQELYGPVNYILGIGGKRLRPVLLLMAYSLFEKDYNRSMPAAMAIEVFHNFTLLHDDIMDDAPLRRGQPTVHEKYDVNTGILSGDVMFVMSYQYLLEMSSSPNFLEVLKVFTRTCAEVCEGQQMDMNFEKRSAVSIKEYLKMIELKTSVLVAGAMQMGALLAGASSEKARYVAAFGRNLGIAFQLQDDLLDTYGDPLKFGKKVGGDISQNKKTFLYLKALELATPGQRAQLDSLYKMRPAEDEAKIRQVIGIFDELDIKRLTEEKSMQFKQEALENLAKLEIHEKQREMLEDFAEKLMSREV